MRLANAEESSIKPTMQEIKITKLPDNLDAKKIADKEMMKGIYRNYSVCPVCGGNSKVFMNASKYSIIPSNNPIGMQPSAARYGYQKGLPFLKRLVTDKMYWCVNHFVCRKCGCEWDSPEFPLFEVPYGYQDVMWKGRLLRTNEFLY